MRARELLLKVISSSFPEWGKVPPSCAKRTFVRLAQEAYEALYNERSLNMPIPYNEHSLLQESGFCLILGTDMESVVR